MGKFRFRSYLDNGMFVLLIVAGCLGSAAMEVGALLGASHGTGPPTLAKADKANEARTFVAASSVDPAVLVAAKGHVRR